MRLLLHGGVLPDSKRADILIEDGLIRDVSSHIEAPADTETVDITKEIPLAYTAPSRIVPVVQTFKEIRQHESDISVKGETAGDGFSAACLILFE